MNVSSKSLPPGEEIDLRSWIESVVRNWYIILGITAIIVAGGAVFSFLVQPTIYESTAGVVLPDNKDETEVGFTAQELLESSNSTPIMDSVRKRLSLEEPAAQLRNRFTLVLEENGVLTATARAESAEEAFLLADAWVESFRQVVSSRFDVQFKQAKSQTDRQVASLWPELTAAEAELERFDLQHPTNLLEDSLSRMAAQAQEREVLIDSLNLRAPESGAIGGGGTPLYNRPSALPGSVISPTSESTELTRPTYIELGKNLTQLLVQDLETDLVASENRLRELVYTSIPIAESRIESLENALTQESRFLEQTLSGESQDNMALNPVYLELSRQLAQTRVSLEVERREVETQRDNIARLESKIVQIREVLLASDGSIPGTVDLSFSTALVETMEKEVAALRTQISAVTEEILSEKSERRALESRLSRLREEYFPAKARQIELADAEDTLYQAYQFTTVREPSLPTSPVSPNRVRDMSLYLLLGLVLGAMSVVVVDFYKSRYTPAPAPTE